MKRASVHSTVVARSIAVVLLSAALSLLCRGEAQAFSDVLPSNASTPPSHLLPTRASTTATAQPAADLSPKRHAGANPGIDGPRTSVKDIEAAPNLRAEILLRAARNSLALGDIPEALSRFEKLLQLTPDNYQARFEYAGLLLQADRLADGRRQLERLVAEQGHVGEYRLALADLLLRLKDYRAVREQVQGLLTNPKYGSRAAIAVARSLVLDHRVPEARRFFDQHLSKLNNLDTKTSTALAQLLIDMDRPAEAVKLLAPLHAADRANATISTTLVLALVRMNSRLDALALIDELDQQPQKDAGPWLELAGQLYQDQAFPEALALYRQVARRSPDQTRAFLGMARTHLRLFEVDRAKEILDAYRGDPASSDYTTVLADYHTLVGEYVEAIAIAKARLDANPSDLQAVILLGDAYHASRQFTLADAAYATALSNRAATDEEQRREILRLQAKNYLLSRRFGPSIAILRALLEEQPSDFGSRILLIETLTEMRCYDAAAALVLPDADVEDPRRRIALQTELGYVYLKQGRAAEAAEQFRMLASDASAALPDVAYGLYRSSQMLGQLEMAHNAYRLGPSPLAPSAMWGVIFAGRAMSYCDCRTAAATLDDALRSSPNNLVLLNMRGEAAQQCDCNCESAACDRGWFRRAMQASPTNIRARLGCARSYSNHLAYECACAEYRSLLRLMPGDVNLVRETARMIDGWQGFERAGCVYAEGMSAAIQDTFPGSSGTVEYVPSGIQSDRAASGATAPSLEIVGGEPIAPGWQSCAPPTSEQLLAAEYRARCLRTWRLHRAIAAYERLIDMEPSNEAAMFDLAQSQSSLNRTRCAADTYQRLLEADPCNHDAAVALWRTRLEMQPKLLSSFDFEDQRGRQGLANITWYDFSASARRPLGDENEFLELGYKQRALQPSDDRVDFGEIPFMRWQRKYSTDSLLFAEVAVEQYQYGLATRPTFNAGLDVLTTNDSEVRVSGFLKNYYVCGEAIRQDIHTTGIQIDGVCRPGRLWTLSGYYRIANFSDDNWVNWFNVNSAHLLWQGRTQVRGLIDYNFYSFAQQTVFGPIPGSLVGTIHPYWSPSGYSYTSAGLELKQWLSCDTFKGANEHFCTLFGGAAVDSNGVGFFLATCRWQKDITPRLTWTVDANLIRSPNQVYNAVGATTYGVLRLW